MLYYSLCVFFFVSVFFFHLYVLIKSHAISMFQVHIQVKISIWRFNVMYQKCALDSMSIQLFSVPFYFRPCS